MTWDLDIAAGEPLDFAKELQLVLHEWREDVASLGTLDDRDALDGAARLVANFDKVQKGITWLLTADHADPDAHFKGLTFVVERLLDGVAVVDDLTELLAEANNIFFCEPCHTHVDAVRSDQAARGIKRTRADCPRCGTFIRFLPLLPRWFNEMELTA